MRDAFAYSVDGVILTVQPPDVVLAASRPSIVKIEKRHPRAVAGATSIGQSHVVAFCNRSLISSGARFPSARSVFFAISPQHMNFSI